MSFPAWTFIRRHCISPRPFGTCCQQHLVRDRRLPCSPASVFCRAVPNFAFCGTSLGVGAVGRQGFDATGASMTKEGPVSDSVLAAGGDAYTYMLQQTSNSTKATATELAETGRCGIVTEDQDCFGFDIHKGYPARCALPPACACVRACVLCWAACSAQERGGGRGGGGCAALRHGLWAAAIAHYILSPLGQRIHAYVPACFVMSSGEQHTGMLCRVRGPARVHAVDVRAEGDAAHVLDQAPAH